MINYRERKQTFKNIIKIWYYTRTRVSYQKDMFCADKVSLNERVLDVTASTEETVTSKCHVGTYFAKWFRCVKFIFGPDVARVRDEASNTSFHLTVLPRRGYHVCILDASEKQPAIPALTDTSTLTPFVVFLQKNFCLQSSLH